MTDGDDGETATPGPTTPLETAEAYVLDEPVAAPEAPEVVLVAPMEKPPDIGHSGFFDPSAPAREPEIVLQRLVEHGRETFALRQPIGYWDAELGGIIVPANLARFRTDLTSVPRLLTWLVPRTGQHLPAALLHDGLIHRPDEPKSYIADEDIDRASADRIMRSAMADLGTSWLRRWLVWTAVAAGTMWAGQAGVAATWLRRIPVAMTVAAVALIGGLATIDLFDCRAVLPWMGDRPTWAEMLLGAAGAIVVPGALAVLWGRRWLAGVIAGVALALLVHVTVAIALVFGVFSAAEAALEGRPARAVSWAGGVVATSALLLGVGASAC